jgi:hypothetical protein
VVVGSEEVRKPISSQQGQIKAEVRVAPQNQVILSLTKVLEEEVQTVQLSQMAQRRFDLRGLYWALGITGGLMFVLLIVLIATSDGDSSSSSWDWD